MDGAPAGRQGLRDPGRTTAAPPDDAPAGPVGAPPTLYRGRCSPPAAATATTRKGD
jgi:hypothetical protein